MMVDEFPFSCFFFLQINSSGAIDLTRHALNVKLVLVLIDFLVNILYYAIGVVSGR